MKCFCCGSDLVAVRQGMSYCESCGMAVDISAHGTAFTKVADYAYDSYKTLYYIKKNKPDIVLADAQLFDKNFTFESVQFLYKDKRNVNAYDTRVNSFSLNSQNYKLDVNKTLIAFNGYLTYNFKHIAASGLAAVPGIKGIVVPNLFNTDLAKFLWHIQLCMNFTEIPDYATDTVYCASIPDMSCLLSDDVNLTDEAACYFYVVNGIHEKFKHSSFNANITLREALLNKVRALVDKESELSDEHIAEYLKGKGVDIGTRLVADIVETYCESVPALTYLGNTLIDPLATECISTEFIKDAFDGTVVNSTLKYWKCLNNLNKKFFYSSLREHYAYLEGCSYFDIMRRVIANA